MGKYPHTDDFGALLELVSLSKKDLAALLGKRQGTVYGWGTKVPVPTAVILFLKERHRVIRLEAAIKAMKELDE